ncbi:alkaline phosphatase family protein [Altericroceibacterium xinjiangense]|uniref:alkaline phosphatase family protein n=1 Tax=Altericroceibacterium xinjiangense TaxID=762261 RepID=UPI000F7E5088|nr:alkaline phosphatase family protein [Altericroceibacterium xinjiangense]
MRLRHVILAATAALACSTPLAAQPADSTQQAAAPAQPPRLIVALSVDQLSGDLFDRYRRRFTGGLARLQDGAVFPAGYQSHAATETCPGHSTILTGMHPARTGIIANMWVDPDLSRADKRVYCAEDEADPASGPFDPVVSAAHLRVPTLGDRLKAAYPGSRNVAVSAKDRSVVMMGGHSIDAAYWWDGSGFTSFAGRPLSPAAQAVNRAATAVIAAGAPALPAPVWCGPTDRDVTVGPMKVGTNRFALAPNKPGDFRASPRADAATADLAVRLVDELQLGRDPVPDVLSVSLSATDYIGHSYGSAGVEMCIQMAEVDRTIGNLLDALDQRGIDYAVMLTSDHGGMDTPERLREQAVPDAARAAPGLLPGAVGEALAARTGLSVPTGPLVLGLGAGGDYYLSAQLDPAQKSRALAELATMLRADPQIAAVFTAPELAALPSPTGSPQDWTLEQRARASFDPERSGDVVALLKRGVVAVTDPGPGHATGHGSPWDYDRRVPILFLRKGMSGFEQATPVETVDIAPTLAALTGLAIPAGTLDGRCLDIDGGPGDTCIR